MPLSFQDKIRPVSNISFADKVRNVATTATTTPQPSKVEQGYKVEQRPEDRALKLERMRAEANTAMKSAKKKGSLMGVLGNTVKGIGETIANAEIGLGQSIGKIYGAKDYEATNQLRDQQLAMVKQIRKLESQGRDASKYKRMYNDNLELLKKRGAPIDDLPTFGEVAGQIGQVGLDLLTPGTYGKATTGMKSFQIASKTPTALTVGKQGAGEVARFFSKKTAKEVAIGGGTGYAFDVTRHLMEGEDPTKLKTYRPGAGTVIGAGVPLVTNAAAATQQYMKEHRKTVSDKVDELAGQIGQGKKKDIAKTRRSLLEMDTDKIKTYDDAYLVANDSVDTMANKLDDFLEADKTVHAWDKLSVARDVGGEKITHNYVDDALNQLEELYGKTNDPEMLAKIRQLRQRAETEGLRAIDVNDLARVHGQARNGFNLNGTPSTGITKQGYENVRKGLKTTARELSPNPKFFTEMDSAMSDMINTRQLFEKQAENVNKFKQKLKERSLPYRVFRNITKAVDTFMGHSITGITHALTNPRNQGAYQMNTLDMEKNLPKAISEFNKLMEKNLDESMPLIIDLFQKEGLLSPSVETITEISGHWPTGLRVKFDRALMNKDAATLKELLPQAPKNYVERFSDEISKVLGGNNMGASALNEAKKYKSAQEFAKAVKNRTTELSFDDSVKLEQSRLEELRRTIVDYYDNILESKTGTRGINSDPARVVADNIRNGKAPKNVINAVSELGLPTLDTETGELLSRQSGGLNDFPRGGTIEGIVNRKSYSQTTLTDIWKKSKNSSPNTKGLGGSALEAVSKNKTEFASGAIAGVEVDEDGNMSFNPEKAAMGMVGMTVARKLTKADLTKLANKIHPEDLAELRDFVDYVGGDWKPKNPHKVEADAVEILEHYGIEGYKTLKGLANAVGKILDAAKFDNKINRGGR